MPAGVTVPIATSVHGVGDSFFHSDVRVLNPSSTASVAVTARYRCAIGSCGVVQRDFVLGALGAARLRRRRGHALRRPGDLRRDRVHRGRGSGGQPDLHALAARADHRDVRPGPDLRRGPPGGGPDVAVALDQSRRRLPHQRRRVQPQRRGAHRDLLALQRPRSPARRGHADRSRPAPSVQVNNVFGAAGVAGDVESAYAVVRADGVDELFAYAAIIDNQSQDLVLHPRAQQPRRLRRVGARSRRWPPSTASAAPSSTRTCASSTPRPDRDRDGHRALPLRLPVLRRRRPELRARAPRDALLRRHRGRALRRAGDLRRGRVHGRGLRGQPPLLAVAPRPHQRNGGARRAARARAGRSRTCPSCRTRRMLRRGSAPTPASTTATTRRSR